MSNLLKRYLTDMGEVRRTGAHVAETSFYPALERLLSDIGKTLSPQVRCVIFLNDAACWRNVPETVWGYTIGGYQVIKKWLSYREKPLLGRGLTPDEVRYVTEMVRRLAALLTLQTSLDDNYRNVIRTTYPWINSEK